MEHGYEVFVSRHGLSGCTVTRFTRILVSLALFSLITAAGALLGAFLIGPAMARQPNAECADGGEIVCMFSGGFIGGVVGAFIGLIVVLWLFYPPKR